MSDKPTYLGLLNAIAVGESEAHCYLTAWIETTTDPDVRCVLAKVAAREGEHGMSFAKRINELGYEVRRKADVNAEKRLALARSKRSDLEKMEKLGFASLDTGDQPDIFDGFFKDHSIDVETGALLGRYIAEERDSGRLLRGCYEQLCAREGRAPQAKGSMESDRLAAVEAKVDAVCAAIDELKTLVSASAPAKSGSPSNGRSRAKAKS